MYFYGTNPETLGKVHSEPLDLHLYKLRKGIKAKLHGKFKHLGDSEEEDCSIFFVFKCSKPKIP